MKYLQILLVLFVIAALSRSILAVWEDRAAAQIRRETSGTMARIIAYLNYHGDPGQLLHEGSLDDAANKLALRRNRWKGIEDIVLMEIPKDVYLHGTPSARYYLYAKKLRLGMLPDGRVFSGEFDPAEINRSTTALQEIQMGRR